METKIQGAGSQQTTGQDKEQTALSGVWAGLLESGLVLAAVLTSDCQVILAELCKDIVELAAMVLSWLALRRIARGSHQYEYGLHKLESLSSLGVGVLMVLSLGILGSKAVQGLMAPEAIGGAGLWIGLASQALVFGLNSRIWVKSRRLAKTERSPLMTSQSRLFLTRALGDIFTVLVIALSLALADHPWSLYIDPLAALALAAIMLLTVAGIFSGSLRDLLDRTLEEEHQIIILRELAEHFERYRNLTHIRSRRAGTRSFVEIGLEFDPA